MDKNRLLTPKINRLLELFPAVAVVGPRQSGKSTLVRALRPEWKYYDLERPDDYLLISSDPLGFFSRQREKTIIDEAQHYPALFQVLRGVIDQDRKAVGRFLLTGSSSPEIVKGLAESLAGRIATVELWPFAMAEYYDQPLSGIYELLASPNPDFAAFADRNAGRPVSQVYEHWLLGGYPEARIKGSQSPEFHGLWLDEYVADYIRRDIQRLFPRLSVHLFRLFIQALIHHSGKAINRSDIGRALEVSSVTVREYLDILHNTFLWRNLQSYDKNTLKKVQKMPKGFFRDQGLLHHLLKIGSLDTLLVHPVAGFSFEAFVVEEIIRGLQCLLKPGIDFYFYRTQDRSEIDLIIEAPFGLIPVEVKLGHTVNRRMLTALENFIAETPATFGILVNNAEKIEALSNTVIQIPARFF